MSLKKDIVLVSEFSIPQPGGRGSRGGTPGAYVTRYMAREQATESLAPVVRQRTDDFIMRYMARESAVEHAPSRQAAKAEMRRAQGSGGVAFGYGSVSLSDAALRAASRDIQRLFDGGHTVMKTVLSFDEEYLRRRAIIDKDFHCVQRGDYRGHIDQMKLRMAIMHGLDRMGSRFDDLRYVAVIQVDTEHVHCHLAMVDAGVGSVTRDGTQRGKLGDLHKSRLRRGIDAWLDDKQAVAQLSSAVGYERRNVTTFIKRWAHERMQTEALPQFLLACLPADRSLWRFGSKSPLMRKPNALVTELVVDQLNRPGSPMPAAMEQVHSYVNERRSMEDLSSHQWQRLVDIGRSQIIERSVNGVYSMLRALPEDELRVRTPMLDVMGMDYEQLAERVAESTGSESDRSSDDLVTFGLRLRSYSSRLEHHRDRYRDYRDLRRAWERADDIGAAAVDSRPLYDFYRFEEEYHARCMAKYQHFLPFATDTATWYERQREVADYGTAMLSLTSLRNDASLQRMRDHDEAEALGRRVYGQSGGGLLTRGRAGRAVLDDRITKMRRRYEEQLVLLREDLAAAGLVLEVTSDPAEEDLESRTDSSEGHSDQADDVVQEMAGEAGRQDGEAGGKHLSSAPVGAAVEHTVVPGARWPFGEVKGLDLHHLGYDFLRDVEIGTVPRREFVRAAHERSERLIAAMEYLDSTDQTAAVADLPTDDVAAMVQLARQLERDPASRLPSRLAQLRADRQVAGPEGGPDVSSRRSAASSLDSGLAVRLQHSIEAAVLDVEPPVAEFAGHQRTEQAAGPAR